MYRDFSAKSKQNMLSLVSQVENEKLSNFTDWVGDRWLDFESWIGKLNIKNYINNVNEYHKKVIDKNNTTQQKIEQIFAAVGSVDRTYKTTFSTVKSSLQQWQSYMDQMAAIVSPQNGKFNSQYINTTLSTVLASISAYTVDEAKGQTKEKMVTGALKAESGFLKAFAKFMKSDFMKKYNNGKSTDAELTASVLSYITGLYTFFTSDSKSPSDLVNSGLKLTKSSTSMWSGLYKYYESSLNSASPLQASRLGKKFQKTSGIVSLVGSLCGFSADAINTFNLFMSGDAEAHEKVQQILKNTGSGLDVAKSIVTLQWGQKSLTRTVTAKYQWAASSANSAKFAKASTVIAVAGVVVDTGQGFASRYGDVTADGTFDMGDIGEVGISGSVRGLTSIVNTATFGISDALGLSDKADDITDGILEFADTKGVGFVQRHEFSSAYVRGAQGMMDYANDESHNVFARIGVSAVAGTGMITAIAIDTVGDACSAIGDGVKKGWNGFKSLFGG